MKFFTGLFLAFTFLQSFCPMQLGMHLMDHEHGTTQEQECPTANCLSHRNEVGEVLHSFNAVLFPAVTPTAQTAIPLPNPFLEASLFRAPPLLFSTSKTIVLRI